MRTSSLVIFLAFFLLACLILQDSADSPVMTSDQGLDLTHMGKIGYCAGAQVTRFTKRLLA